MKKWITALTVGAAVAAMSGPAGWAATYSTEYELSSAPATGGGVTISVQGTGFGDAGGGFSGGRLRFVDSSGSGNNCYQGNVTDPSNITVDMRVRANNAATGRSMSFAYGNNAGRGLQLNNPAGADTVCWNGSSLFCSTAGIDLSIFRRLRVVANTTNGRLRVYDLDNLANGLLVEYVGGGSTNNGLAGLGAGFQIGSFSGGALTDYEVDYFRVSIGTAQEDSTTAFTTSAERPFLERISLPGVVQAEDYDEGGEGVAFHNTGTDNSPNFKYRPGPPNIDVGPSVGYKIGWIDDGEYWKYSVNVVATGQYDITMRAASPPPVGVVRIAVDGVNIPEGTITLTDSGAGNWETYLNTVKTGVTLTAGDHVLTVTKDSGDMNFDYFVVLPTSTTGNGVCINRGSADNSPVSSFYNLTNVFNGTGTDGISTAEILVEQDCRRAVAGHYMYFDVSSNYTLNGNHPDQYIVVRYLDLGTTTLAIEYDSSTSAYQALFGPAMTNTNTWKSYTFHVTNAKFNNSENGGADFRVSAAGATFALDTVVLYQATATSISPQPTAQTVCVGQTATFSLTAAGTGLLYQWRKNGVNLNNVAPYSGTTTNTLTITNAQTGDAAVAGSGYDCVVTGSGGSVTSTRVALTVKTTPANRTVSAQDSTVCSGTGTNIQVASSESGVSYQLKTEAGTAVGSAQSGNGGTLSFATGNLTTTTQFKVEATNSPCAVQTMSVHPTVTVPNCDDGIACTIDGCSNGSCTHTPNDAACSDNNVCNGIETCNPATGCVPGTPLNCNDGNPCTDDGCDAISGCYHTNNSNACDDGNACTVGDTCSGGSCAGSPRDCNDNDACTTDTCNPATGCVHTPISCDDGIACTVDTCDPQSGCVYTPNNAACSDNNVCNGIETCDPQSGCVPGTPLDCNDGNPCTDDGCDAITGCYHTNNTNACSDGSACTENDTCSGGVCAGTPVNCDDSDACTADACDPQTGCTHTAIVCNDGDPCTTDTCDPQTGCVYTPVTCDDSDPCTTDSCNPQTGQCEHTPVNCDDSNACTTDSCDQQTGQCVHVPVVCNDNNICTVDTCDPQNGCVYTPSVAACDDNNVCTDDGCDIQTGECTHTPHNCDDGNACTADTCDPQTGCMHTAISCDDNDACTVDACDPQTGCTHTALVCDDADACTTDTCDPQTGCVYTPVDCDDHDACTTDSCNGLTGQCEHVAIDCDDDNPCTDDSCDPQTGCVHVNNSNACNDGNACTQTDTCQNGTCTGLNPVVCTASDQCHEVGTCNPNTGQCSNPPVADGTTCDDTIAATPYDSCWGGVCVGTNQPPQGSAYYKDDTDNGNDAFNAGCHWSYSDAACSQNKTFSAGDQCFPNGMDLREWTDQNCHPFMPLDVQIHYCDAECINAGFQNGSCVTVPNHCGPGNDSAKCVCMSPAPDQCHTAGTCNPTTGECFYPPVADGTPCDDGSACTQTDTCSNGTCAGTPLDCNDGNPCTTDSCDPQSGCVYTNNSEACSDGDACTENDTCSNGACAGTPVSCDDGNACTTDACDHQTGCTHLAVTCSDDNVCNGIETCDPQTGCQPGTPLDCNDGNPCTDDSCDPQNGCQHVNNSAACSDGNACTENDTCSNGACAGTPVDCDDHNACTADACDPQTGCTHTAIVCDDGQACTTDTCDPQSGCVYTPVDCDDNNPCTTDACNPLTGQCEHVAVDCDDHNACTTDSCDTQTGQCVHTPVVCDDGNICTTDSCDPQTGCVYTPTVTECDDHNACTNDGCTLETGECTHTPVDCDDHNACTADSCDPESGCVHTPIGCDDGNACTVDACDPQTGCTHTAMVCNDGDPCTTDTCDLQSGCVYALVDCDDHNACTTESCNGQTGQCDYVPVECDDHNVCNGLETCNPETGCVAGTPLVCNDNNPCTDDSCHSVLGCQFVNNSDACSDGNACTGNDTCSGGACIGTPVDCDDHNACTADACDPQTGCTHTPIVCNDGDPCTSDTCDPQSGCVYTPVTCDDGNPCTIDSCNGLTGQCEHTPVDCDDHNACTTDSCDTQTGQCVHTPVVCDDQNICTTDSCDPQSGCVYTPTVAECDDHNACTQDGCDLQSGECTHTPVSCDDGNACTADSCDPQTGCVHTPISCDDSNACTVDACDPQTGCTHTPVVCDDGDPCTTDTCDPQSGCVYTAVDCDDHNACTVDSCNGQTGQCEHVEVCDDHNVCNGIETCDPQTGCIPGTPLNCNDGNPCTDDSCDPVLGCQHVNNSNACNDGNACTTGDTCVNGACEPGGPVDCDDHDACTEDGCDPQTGCTHVAVVCSDNNVCNGLETCDPQTGCQPGTPLNCNDGNPCTADSCHPLLGCQHVGTRTVVGRDLFYNNSFYDSATTTCNTLVGQTCSDNTAIATDKSALNPGGTAGTGHYVSYSRGINGLMIDVKSNSPCGGLPGGPLSPTNFEFRVGNTPTLAGFTLAAAPLSIDVTPDGVNGSDRIKIIWSDNAIPNSNWLRVLVKSNPSGGQLDLDADNVFYFGLAIGDSLTPGGSHVMVNSTDDIDARNHPHNSLNRVPVAMNSGYAVPAAPDAKYDYDKSSLVSSTDEIIARNNPANSLNGLLLLNPAP